MNTKALFAALIVSVLLIVAAIKVIPHFKIGNNAPVHVVQPIVAGPAIEPLPTPTMEGVEFDLSLGAHINRNNSVFEVNDSKARTLLSLHTDIDPNYAKGLFSYGSFPTTTPAGEISGSKTIVQRRIGTIGGIEVYGYSDEGHSYDDDFYFVSSGGQYVFLELNPVIEGRLTTEQTDAYYWNNLGVDPLLYKKVRDSLHLSKD